MTDEQLALDGIEPAKMKRTRLSRVPPHLPTIADAEAMRLFVRDGCAIPGRMQSLIERKGIADQPLLVLKMLNETGLRLTMTKAEAKRLLALADKWESEALAREKGL